MVYSIKLLLVISVTALLSLLAIPLGFLDRDGKIAYRVSRLWTWAILKIGGVRLKVSGLEHLDPGRQYIFMANHQSNIDIPALVQGLSGFQLRWVAKKELLFVPLFGWAMWASRHIVVDRFNRLKAAASLRKAKARIEGGISVVLFPEGTRSSDGRILPFKRGGFVLAVRTKTPIVPITINGSGAILPRGDWRLRRGEIEVIVSAPIFLEPYHTGNIRVLLDRVRVAVESHSRHPVRPSGPASQGAQALRAEARLER